MLLILKHGHILRPKIALIRYIAYKASMQTNLAWLKNEQGDFY